MTEKNLDLTSEMDELERALAEHALKNISPDDAKYRNASAKLSDYLSADAEWRGCAFVQKVLLETRMEFGQAEQWNVDEVEAALEKISPLNMSLIESKVTRHDQLAVIAEISRYVSPETEALLHPGTTSYDILDTARSYLFKRAWYEVIRPEASKTIEKLCDLAERSLGILQVGRTHLQDTTPVPLGLTFSTYAGRLADRVEKCDSYFDGLKGKVSGIVGTGAGIEMVVGYERSMDFEVDVLAKLGLQPDYTATQVVQKERLADVGNGLTTMAHVLNDFANDVRILYSSAIQEMTSRDNQERLGGSSADALKNNPINYENIAGKATVVESGMRILYELITTDLQRDLRSSVQARYQPQQMMAVLFESFSRVNGRLKTLSINEDKMEENLQPVRDYPSEAMTSILRGEGWIHPEYGTGHEFVKKIGQKAKLAGIRLIDAAREDSEFEEVYESLDKTKQDILHGDLEKYTGSYLKRAAINIAYGRKVAMRE